MIRIHLKHYCCEDCGSEEILKYENDGHLECNSCNSDNIHKTQYLKDLEETMNDRGD